MKNYGVYINTTSQLFHEKNLQRIGSCAAKNKDDAIDKVYKAFWQEDAGDEVYIYPEFTGLVGPSARHKMVAIIE